MTMFRPADHPHTEGPAGPDAPTAAPISVESAPQVVIDSMRGVFLARALYAVAALDVADRLAAGPRCCAELADELGLQPRPLHQVLRALTGTGLLRTLPGPEIGPSQRFALTSQGQALRKAHPSGTHELITTMQGASIQDSLAMLPQRLATHRTGPELALGAPFFEHLRANPSEAAAFDRMMIALHANESVAVAHAYDFSWAHTIVDVGGGVGGFLVTVLRRYPPLFGVIAELPQVAERARRYLAEHAMADRCKAVAADFFSHLPPGADAYLLTYVLHNWDDESCRAILRTCASAMTPHSRLLVVEAVLPADDSPHPGKLLDLVMVTLTKGVERETREYQQLAEQAGLRLAAEIPTNSAVSVLEFVPAQ